MIDRDPLREALGAGNALHNLLEAHGQFYGVDIQQTAACNALHTVEARMCRWLLRMMDLSKTTFQLTQDQLTAMVAARHTSVSEAAINLQSKGFIAYSRGAVTATNVVGLKQLACGCYN